MKHGVGKSVVRVGIFLVGLPWGVYAALLLAYGTRYLWATSMVAKVDGTTKLIYMNLAYSALYKMHYRWVFPFVLWSLALAILLILKRRWTRAS